MTRTALVTGASRGLGKEVCAQLAATGARVLAATRAGPVVLDVADDASVRACADRLRADGVRLDLLVNNAGLYHDGTDPAEARACLDVNFFGAMRVTDALLPLLDDGGAIVNVSSGMGELSHASRDLQRTLLDPALTRAHLEELVRSFLADGARARGWPASAYRVSKIALNAFTRISARDLAARKIRVNAVCPGWVATDMGGKGAPRSVEKGARSIVLATELRDTGTFTRDGRVIDW
jgi:NAD(P)-dependent dehydrogenase (short-subunit alcohol dehydrogenase family)